MKTLLLTLVGLFMVATVVGGCQKNERVIERRETIQVQSQAVPIVVPD